MELAPGDSIREHGMDRSITQVCCMELLPGFEYEFYF